MDDLFNEENVAESNWFKFEKVGDKVSGILVEVADKTGDGDFGPQRIYHLKQEDGTVTKVGINLAKDYVIARANSARMGDTLGFRFEKEVPSQKFKGKMAKSIEVYIKRNEPSDGNDPF